VKYSLNTECDFSELSSLTYVIATKRSGHHAFIEWMCSHLSDYLYLNNVNVNPDIERDKYQKPHIETDIDLDFADADDDVGNIHYKDAEVEHLMLSFENKAVKGVSRAGRLNSLAHLSERESVKTTAVLFLRDPINCLASIARYNEVNPNFKVSVEQQAEKWVALAKDFYAPERAENLLDAKVKTVRYNDFIRNKVKVAHLLGDHVEQSTQRMSSLSRFGGGGDSKFGNAKTDMSVESLESRWQMLASPASLKEVFDDNSELRELSRRFYQGSEMSGAMKLGVETFLGSL